MKKNGFTLIELLAVMAIIIIIVGLGAPTLINVLKNNKEKAQAKTIEIIESAARSYAIDYGESAGSTICISTLCSKEYLSCPINNAVDDTVMDGCVIVTKDANNIESYSYNSSITENVMINLTIDLDGGSIETDPTDSYYMGSIITLTSPIKENHVFMGWIVKSGNSTISGNNLIVGTEDTTIEAIWKTNVQLSVNLDGGIISNNPEGTYLSETHITLEPPTKENHVFMEWIVKSGNSTISGNNLIVGTEDTTIEAIWKTNVQLSVNLDGGIISNNPEGTYLSETRIIPETPTKEYYTFSEWIVTTGNSTVSENILILGTENTTIKALWTKSFSQEYSYTGDFQEFTVPTAGIYKIELWGAQGGGTSNIPGGAGAYTSGNIMLNENEILYFYVGSSSTLSVNSYNGGGNTNNSHYPTYDGGGATDVRLSSGVWNNSASLISRIMVAGGGGGTALLDETGARGGCGGTLSGKNGGYTGVIDSFTPPTGGTQISGGKRDTANAYVAENGSFGKGGNGDLSYGGGGGGGGWYGGGGGSNYKHVSSGGGGSSYISGYTGCVAVTSEGDPKPGCDNGTTDNLCSIHNSGKTFTNMEMKAGNEEMRTHDGESTMIGNSGDGYAKITYIASE